MTAGASHSIVIFSPSAYTRYRSVGGSGALAAMMMAESGEMVDSPTLLTAMRRNL